MLVLDEQLIGRGLERAIAHWYRGTVCFVNDLRPNSIIKDEAVPSLLHQQRRPTFITINERDFWQRSVIDSRFCVICFALNDSQVALIDSRLRVVLRDPTFRTKANRMGCVIRVSGTAITYYRYDDPTVRVLD